MKRISQAAVIILIVLLFASCSSKTSDKYQLEVTVSSWNGWSSDYQPAVEVYYYEITENETISLTDAGLLLDFTFQITSVKTEEITIKTNQAMSDNGDGTINLRSQKTVFTIKANEELELISCTTDEGDIIIFRLIEK